MSSLSPHYWTDITILKSLCPDHGGHGLSHGIGLNQRTSHWVSEEVDLVGSHGVDHRINLGVGHSVGHVSVHGVSHRIGQRESRSGVLSFQLYNVITTLNRNCPLPDTIEQGEAFSREGGGLAFCTTRLVILLLLFILLLHIVMVTDVVFSKHKISKH